MRLIVESDGLYPYLYDSPNMLLLAIQHICQSEKARKLVQEELEQRIGGYSFRVIILPGP